MGKVPYKNKLNRPTTNAPPPEILVDSVPTLPQAELQTALNLIPAHSWYAVPSGALTFVNERGSDYLGLPKDHPLRFGTDINAEWDSHIPHLHPDDHEETRRVWAACLRLGCTGQVSFRVRNAEGTYRWFLSRAEPLRASDGAILYWIGVNHDIEDRKQAELYLAEGQRLARIGSWALNAAGFDYWSPELFRIYGLDPNGKAPTLEEYIELVHPDDRQFVAETIQKMFAEHRGFDFTKRIVRPDGEIRRIRCVAGPATQAGAVEEFIGTAMDVTEHELLTQELRRREAYLSEAQRLSQTGSFGWKPDSGEIVWSDETFRIFEYDRAEKPTLDMVFQRIHPHDRALAQQVIEGVSGSTDFEHEYRLVMPSGAIKHIRVRAHALSDSSGNIEVVGAVTDITERKTNEEKIRRLVEAGILGIFFANLDGEIVEANQAFLQLLQYDREDLVSGRLRWADLTPAEWRERDERAVTEFLETGVFHYEKEYFRKDGSRVPVLVGGARLQSANEGVVYVLDLSEQKRAEEKIRMSESYLAEAQRLSHTGSWAWSPNPDQDISYWSEECYRVLGFDPAGPLPQFEEFFQAIHPDDRAASREGFDIAIRDKADFELNYRIVHPDKGVRDIHAVGRAVLDRSGDLHEFVGTVIDITERKQAEEELRRSEAYLAEAQKLSQTGSWAWSPEVGINYWSEECYRVLGFDPRDGLPEVEEFFARIHPDDQEEFQELTLRGIREKLDHEPEYRIVHPSGAIRDIHTTSHPVLGPSGDLVEITGTVIDITERKRSEDELRASERKYRNLVDTTPAFVRTAVANGDVDFYNRGWLEYVGLTLTDLLGWGWTSVIHPEDIETGVPKWRAALEAGEPFIGESRVRRADGEYRWFLHREEPLRNEAGEIVKWYGSSIEIEERKIAEEKIRAQEAELRQILDLTPQHIGVFAPSGEPLYLNDTGIEYFGTTMWRADAGRPKATNSWPGSRLDLVHPEDREHFVRERRNGFLDGRPFEHEARLLRHDGQFRCFLIRFAPLKDDLGDITRWIGTGNDIEDRRRVEEGMRNENIALREEIDKASMFEDIVGESPVLQTVLVRVAKVAPTESTVLITGETGTGKELIARAIHKRSKRSSRAFVAVNCAAIPESLIASELFGHEKGSFTGAMQRRVGKFEAAEGGTIFLDEVGDLPAETQVALLRVLQEQEFERVGGNRPIPSNVRVVAATNCALEAAIAASEFRSDLYYRLNVFPIELPPLRERQPDIPLLAEYFIDRYSKKAGKRIKGIDKKTLDLLISYHWPGNIRELQNVIERSLIVNESENFTVDSSWLVRGTHNPQAETPLLSKNLRTQEKAMIEAALAESGGRVAGPAGAASKLGIPKSTLESKIKSLRIAKHRFKLG